MKKSFPTLSIFLLEKMMIRYIFNSMEVRKTRINPTLGFICEKEIFYRHLKVGKTKTKNRKINIRLEKIMCWIEERDLRLEIMIQCT